MGAGAQTGGDSGEQDRGQRADRGIVVLTGEHEPLVADGQGGVDLAGVVGGDEQGTDMTRRFAVWNEVTGLTAAA